MSEWDKTLENLRLALSDIPDDEIVHMTCRELKKVKAEGDRMQKRIEELETINVELAIRYGSLIKKNIDVEKKLEAIQNIIESNRYDTVKLFMIEIAFKYDVWTVEEIKERWKGKCDE